MVREGEGWLAVKGQKLSEITGRALFCPPSLRNILQEGFGYDVGYIFVLDNNNELVPTQRQIQVARFAKELSLGDVKQKHGKNTAVSGGESAGVHQVELSIAGKRIKSDRVFIEAAKRKRRSIFSLSGLGLNTKTVDFEALFYEMDLEDLALFWRIFGGPTVPYKLHFFLIATVENAEIQAFYYEGKRKSEHGIFRLLPGFAGAGGKGERKEAENVGSSEKGNIGYSLLGFTVYDHMTQCLVSDCTPVVSEECLESFLLASSTSCFVLATFADRKDGNRSSVYMNVKKVREEEAYQERVKKIMEEIRRRSNTSDDDPEPEPGNNVAAQQHESDGQPPGQLPAQSLPSGKAAPENEKEEETQHMLLGTLVVLIGSFACMLVIAYNSYNLGKCVALLPGSSSVFDFLPGFSPGAARGPSLGSAKACFVPGRENQKIGGRILIFRSLFSFDIDRILFFRRLFHSKNDVLHPYADNENCETADIHSQNDIRSLDIGKCRDFVVGAAIIILCWFIAAIYFVARRRLPARSVTASHQHPHPRTPIPAAAAKNGRTQIGAADKVQSPENLPPTLALSTSLSPASGEESARTVPGSRPILADDDEEKVVLESLRQAVNQSSSSGFALFHHDFGAARNNRCDVFLRKKNVNTAQVVEEVNIGQALETILAMIKRGEATGFMSFRGRPMKANDRVEVQDSRKYGTPTNSPLSNKGNDSSPDSDSSKDTNNSPTPSPPSSTQKGHLLRQRGGTQSVGTVP